MNLTPKHQRELYNHSLYKSANFQYESLVIENTNKCTAKCGICYLSAGDAKTTDRLDLKVAKKCIREASKLDCLQKRLHLAGGESFIYPDDCKELFACAKKSGYETISCTTNAFWCRNLDHANRICETMRKSGLDYMEISWDYWHYQFVKPECINNCIRACYENGITSNLRLLSTKSHNMGEVMDFIDPDVIPLIGKISSGPVSYIGRANSLDENEVYAPACGFDASCSGSLNLAINAKGFVAPCCCGFDQCHDYVCGNIYEESIIKIVENMDEDQVLRRLIFKGVASFMPILKKCGIKLHGKRISPCRTCVQMFSTRENIDAIRNYIKQENFENLKKVLASFAGSNG